MLDYVGEIQEFSISDLFGYRKVARIKVKPFFDRLEGKDYEDIVNKLNKHLPEKGEIVIYTVIEYINGVGEEVFLYIAKEVKIDD